MGGSHVLYKVEKTPKQRPKGSVDHADKQHLCKPVASNSGVACCQVKSALASNWSLRGHWACMGMCTGTSIKHGRSLKG